MHGAMASGNFIQADVIGEACPTGNCLAVTTPIPNGSHGVFFRDGAHDNAVGPASPSDPRRTSSSARITTAPASLSMPATPPTIGI